jgi:hypothetical protein
MRLLGMCNTCHPRRFTRPGLGLTVVHESNDPAGVCPLNKEQGSHEFPRRLAIRIAEKQDLLRQIDRDFGAELQDDQQTYLVNAATVIRNALRKHKASDEN